MRVGAGERFVDTPAGVRELAAEVRDHARVGLDTEFIAERTYSPQLELLQLALGESTAVIDCRAAGSLDALLEALLEPAIEKVVHAGVQDLDLIFQLTGRVMRPVFDTQVAAAMVGFGAQPGYAALVERVLHVSLAKSETLTDWSRRPLSRRQIAYAHDDVRYLLPLRDHLSERLRQLGREAWLREELRRLEDAATYRRPDPQEAYLRVRGHRLLRGQSLAVLRALAAWREREAQARNKPRAAILADDLLVELARRLPRQQEDLRALRGQFGRAVSRHAEGILRAVAEGLEVPPERWPAPAAGRGRFEPPGGIVEVLQAALRRCAEEVQISPTLIGTAADLHALVGHVLGAKTGEVRLLCGWRYEVAGRKLLAVLQGEVAVRVEPGTLRLVME